MAVSKTFCVGVFILFKIDVDQVALVNNCSISSLLMMLLVFVSLIPQNFLCSLAVSLLRWYSLLLRKSFDLVAAVHPNLDQKLLSLALGQSVSLLHPNMLLLNHDKNVPWIFSTWKIDILEWHGRDWIVTERFQNLTFKKKYLQNWSMLPIDT